MDFEKGAACREPTADNRSGGRTLAARLIHPAKYLCKPFPFPLISPLTPPPVHTVWDKNVACGKEHTRLQATRGIRVIRPGRVTMAARRL